MVLHRSLLFVPETGQPGSKEQPGPARTGSILDLEDSVPAPEKAAARTTTAAAINAHGDNLRIFVRLNGWGSGDLLDDLMATIGHGVAGYFLPKVDGPEDVSVVIGVLEEVELRRGLPGGGLEVVPIPEICASAVPHARPGCGVRPCDGRGSRRDRRR